MTRVVLHIGSFKTGTSFIQSVLKANKDKLAKQGVLWPGLAWGDQVKWAASIRSSKPIKPARSRAVVDEINAWDGPTALISMEFLSLANERAVRKAMGQLRDHEVEVVLTARDLGRVFPAQWQESVQDERSWSYQEYIDRVIVAHDPSDKAFDHFWTRHDWPEILRTWATEVPVEKMTLVTVPPAGSDRMLLWNRFCEAVNMDPTAFDTSVRVNDSLGAASAEVMRYAAKAMDERGRAGRVTKKRILAKEILVARRSEEPTLILPSTHRDWAMAETDRMLDGLRALGPKVLGDLSELLPRFDQPQGSFTDDPSTLPVEDLLAAAGAGLMGMCAYVASSDQKSH